MCGKYGKHHPQSIPLLPRHFSILNLSLQGDMRKTISSKQETKDLGGRGLGVMTSESILEEGRAMKVWTLTGGSKRGTWLSEGSKGE